ncbi:enoyl-CoA hydratase [Marinobacter sp. R17]|uniref:enoyl-CoA hydratase-related protein n=1 Tax=Marinobacter sp. R17 TaxID=2484250 RepID=UPI000F4B466E|nr:enoyl-CoA hydratase-related protein [Marinobacter sp. R17]ROT99609.1 enoyl-CoA hydratase [Marinobacter sp. R17]
MSDSFLTDLTLIDGLAHMRLPQSTDALWSDASLDAFYRDVQSLDRRQDVRGLVIEGQPGQPFSHGVDLALFHEGSKTAGAGVNREFGLAFNALRRFPGVSAAALTGDAADAGLECALCCDFRIAEPSVRLSMVPARYGLVPVGGGSQLLPRLVGEVWAKRLLLCGETVNAETALAIGLVDAISEPGQASELASDWVRRSFRQGPQAVRATKQLIEHARMRPLETGFAAERDWMVELQGTAEQIEGIQAADAGRTPHWPDHEGEGGDR